MRSLINLKPPVPGLFSEPFLLLFFYIWIIVPVQFFIVSAPSRIVKLCDRPNLFIRENSLRIFFLKFDQHHLLRSTPKFHPSKIRTGLFSAEPVPCPYRIFEAFGVEFVKILFVDFLN